MIYNSALRSKKTTYYNFNLQVPFMNLWTAMKVKFISYIVINIVVHASNRIILFSQESFLETLCMFICLYLLQCLEIHGQTPWCRGWQWVSDVKNCERRRCKPLSKASFHGMSVVFELKYFKSKCLFLHSILLQWMPY